MDNEGVIDMVNHIKELKKALSECLELWEIMSALEDMDVEAEGLDALGRSKYFKDLILREVMGIEDNYSSGCPFCERYIALYGCDGCPIDSDVKDRPDFHSEKTFACFDTEYEDWDSAVNSAVNKGRHVQEHAQDFFGYLLKINASISG